jgi:transcriptional regulator with GAF, ATPase, and Fis domain
LDLRYSLRPDDYQKPEKIFSILSTIIEVLSTSNRHQQLLDMALDTLLEVLKVDCCWVQLRNFESGELRLAACRALNTDIKRVIVSTDLGQLFNNRSAVLGHKIAIPDLSRDEENGLSSFSKAGLRSLVAVPMRTYRLQGLLGVAFRTKKRSLTGITELLMVIASLIGLALDKANLYERMIAREEQSNAGAQLEETPNLGKSNVHQHSASGLKEAIERLILLIRDF